MQQDPVLLASETAINLALLELFFVWNEATIQDWLKIHLYDNGWLGHDPSGEAAIHQIFRFAATQVGYQGSISEFAQQISRSGDGTRNRYESDANIIIENIRADLAEHNLDKVFRWKRTLLLPRNPTVWQSSPSIAHANGAFTHHWTADDFYRAHAINLFPASAHMELIAGELLLCKHMSPIIASTITLCRDTLWGKTRDDVHIRQRLPLFVGYDGLPEPSLAVVRGNGQDYAHQHPLPSDVLLVVEVADSQSIAFDRGRKAAYYAEVELPEYWIINLEEQHIEIYCNPASDAPTEWGFDYKSRQIARHGEKITPSMLPDMQIAVSNLLPSL